MDDKSNELAMAIYLLSLAHLESNGKTYVTREIRETQRKLHESLGLSKQK